MLHFGDGGGFYGIVADICTEWRKWFICPEEICGGMPLGGCDILSLASLTVYDDYKLQK